MSGTPLRIDWLVDGVTGSWDEGHSAALASNRYRAILPASALRERSHRVELVAAEAWTWAAARGQVDIVMAGKMLPGHDLSRYHQVTETLRAELRLAEAGGAKVVADFNDDHFDHPVRGAHWRQMARLVGLCTAGSQQMAERLAQVSDRPVQVIGDPLGSPAGEARVFEPQRKGGIRWISERLPGGSRPRLKLVWYGNLPNWPALKAWSEPIGQLARQQPLLLWVVTQASAAVDDFVAAFNQRHRPDAMAEFLQWEEATQWDVVRDADVVLIPSDPGDSRKAVKSANRLSDALNAGRFVVASPMPAYLPYGDFVALTDDPAAALRDYLARPQANLQKLRAGQQAVRERCGLPAIGDAWEAAFRTPVPRVDTTNNTISWPGEPVRLNLGCGDKILPGYVNVDLAGNWSGRAPDVVADITEPLPFPDHHADEIHAYHVVEHLLRWKVEACLCEWVRVLKPQGRLILELPCLDKIIGLFNHFREIGEAPARRLTLLGLYGDPDYREERMLHRWCYSVAELRSVLERIGLREVQEQEPQTHIQIRDMRLVGIKPLDWTTPVIK